MEISAYLFLYILALVCFIFAIWKNNPITNYDIHLRASFTVICAILFIILSVSGLDIEIITSDGSAYQIGAPTSTNPSGTLEWVIFPMISVLFFVFMLINLLNIVSEYWRKGAKGMKIPGGFGTGRGKF